jgi:hypothetical protein
VALVNVVLKKSSSSGLCRRVVLSRHHNPDELDLKHHRRENLESRNYDESSSSIKRGEFLDSAPLSYFIWSIVLLCTLWMQPLK